MLGRIQISKICFRKTKLNLPAHNPLSLARILPIYPPTRMSHLVTRENNNSLHLCLRKYATYKLNVSKRFEVPRGSLKSFSTSLDKSPTTKALMYSCMGRLSQGYGTKTVILIFYWFPRINSSHRRIPTT